MNYRWLRKRRRKEQPFPEITLTPLIDTALNLLIIFMVTAPMLKKENALLVELPKGNIKEVSDTQKQDLIVTIDKSGKIYFNNQLVTDAELIKSLQKSAGPKDQKTVFVKGDSGASFGRIIETVDKIKQAGGIGYVALATSGTVS